jgi:hypothetical protein
MEETRQLNKPIGIIKKLILICIGWRGFTHFRSPLACNKNSISGQLYYWQEAWAVEFILNKERLSKINRISNKNSVCVALLLLFLFILNLFNTFFIWIVASCAIYNFIFSIFVFYIKLERYKFYKNENRNI